MKGLALFSKVACFLAAEESISRGRSMGLAKQNCSKSVVVSKSLQKGFQTVVLSSKINLKNRKTVLLGHHATPRSIRGCIAHRL